MKFSDTVDNIVYIGGGYVGLVGAISFAKRGIPTVIFDTNPDVCSAIMQGKPKGEDFLKYLHADVALLVQHNLLRAISSDWEHRAGFKDIFIIAVPSEQDGEPYMDIVESVFEKILTTDRTRHPTIIIESTVVPGTLDKLIEIGKKYNCTHGVHYYLAVAPRRDWFADKEKNVENLTRIVGGINEQATQRAVHILSKVSQDIRTTDYKTAELVKGLENSLLNVPVLYAHELALLYPNHNIREALKLAATHWRIPEYHLNLGTSGRCVPLGTKYMSAGASDGIYFPSISSAVNETNMNFRENVVEFIHTCVEHLDRANVLILGLGYRKDFTDIGLSPGIEIGKNLLQYSDHIDVFCCDPLLDSTFIDDLDFFVMYDNGDCFQRQTNTRFATWQDMDCILLATPHTLFMKYPHEDWRWKEGQLVLDPMGTWKGFQGKFKNMGVDYRIIGEPGWRSLERKNNVAK